MEELKRFTISLAFCFGWNKTVSKQFWNCFVSVSFHCADGIRGDWKCGSGNAMRSKMQGWKMQEYSLSAWKAEPRLLSETALSYFLKIVLSLWVNKEWFLAAFCSWAPFTGKPRRLIYTYNTANSANLVRELVNYTTAQTVSPYTPGCIYVRSGLFMSIVHSLSENDSLQLTLVSYSFLIWQLSVRYSSCIFYSLRHKT